MNEKIVARFAVYEDVGATTEEPTDFTKDQAEFPPDDADSAK